MRLIGLLLVGIFAVALLRLVVIALCVSLLIILLWAAIMRPRQALGLILFGVIGAVAEAYPAITLGLLVIMTVTYLIGNK